MTKPKLIAIRNKYSCYFTPYISCGFYEHAWIDHKRTYFIEFCFLRLWLAVELDVKHVNPE